MRLIPTASLRRAYLRRANASDAPNYILRNGLEIGIVASDCAAINRAISSLLCSVLDTARNSAVGGGGHLPEKVVQRIQQNVISPDAVEQLWGRTGYRFLLTRSMGDSQHELLATILVGSSSDTLFFFTGAYNNLAASRLSEQVDLRLPHPQRQDLRWFSQFDFPDLSVFKPSGYHQIANFAVSVEHQAQGLGRCLLDTIHRHYSEVYLSARGLQPQHSQPLLAGRGFWQLGDPPWLVKMRKLGFYLRAGAESFFIDQAELPLPDIFAPDGQRIAHTTYNAAFGLPQLYDDVQALPPSAEHLRERIARVQALARSGRAKLQYFQTLFDFVV